MTPFQILVISLLLLDIFVQVSLLAQKDAKTSLSKNHWWMSTLLFLIVFTVSALTYLIVSKTGG